MTSLLLVLSLAFALTAQCAFACQVSWTAPTTNTDGTPVTALAVYKLYLGGVQQGGDVSAPATAVTLQGTCKAGIWTVTAVTTQGMESAHSTPFVVTVPSAPSNVLVKP